MYEERDRVRLRTFSMIDPEVVSSWVWIFSSAVSTSRLPLSCLRLLDVSEAGWLSSTLSSGRTIVDSRRGISVIQLEYTLDLGFGMASGTDCLLSCNAWRERPLSYAHIREVESE